MKNKSLFTLPFFFLFYLPCFATSGELIDSRDGHTYKVVEIDSTRWMAENLQYNAEESSCYDNKEENCEKYGRLYSRNLKENDINMPLCPKGWNLPSSEQWSSFINKMSIPFSFSGYQDVIESYHDLNRSSFFWTKSIGEFLYINSNHQEFDTTSLNYAFSIRCVFTAVNREKMLTALRNNNLFDVKKMYDNGMDLLNLIYTDEHSQISIPSEYIIITHPEILKYVIENGLASAKKLMEAIKERKIQDQPSNSPTLWDAFGSLSYSVNKSSLWDVLYPGGYSSDDKNIIESSKILYKQGIPLVNQNGCKELENEGFINGNDINEPFVKIILKECEKQKMIKIKKTSTQKKHVNQLIQAKLFQKNIIFSDLNQERLQ